MEETNAGAGDFQTQQFVERFAGDGSATGGSRIKGLIAGDASPGSARTSS